jgi:hypothetical protein
MRKDANAKVVRSSYCHGTNHLADSRLRIHGPMQGYPVPGQSQPGPPSVVNGPPESSQTHVNPARIEQPMQGALRGSHDPETFAGQAGIVKVSQT